jgi:uncharacterized membrane protein
MQRGFPLSEVDQWDTGMLFNFCAEHDRLARIRRGEAVHDDLQRYRVLKEMEPEMDRRYAAGEIKEHKYREYKATLKKCEDLLGGD